MALILEEEKKESNTFAFIAIAVVAVGFAVGAYLLFFSPAPLVGEILPPSIQTISTISNVKLDVSPIIGSQAYRNLNTSSTLGTPLVGQTGKSNPFIK
ncbi:MAG TPA: hypothetical protein VMU70_01915 [Candidatus Tyrphobacter sp.]|nr:hypothetical protein [Candidatus Tyrphobacter sp.]